MVNDLHFLFFSQAECNTVCLCVAASPDAKFSERKLDLASGLSTRVVDASCKPSVSGLHFCECFVEP